MNLKDLKTPEEIELWLLTELEFVESLKIGLSDDSSVYQKEFIQQRLAKCSHAQEQVSDRMMQLTRISIEVLKVLGAKEASLRNLTYQLKASAKYEDQPREKKTAWLMQQLQSTQNEVDRWTSLKRVVSEVKEAVSGRGQDLKRLDSDLRLHAKLLEVGLPGGAASHGSSPPRSPTKGVGATGEVDIN